MAFESLAPRVRTACSCALAVFGGLAPVETPALEICGGGRRTHCVVDGDTLWLAGEKVRLSGIDAPEVSEPKCTAERRLGEIATRRLSALMDGEPIELQRQGLDKYGRTLAVVWVQGRDVGEVLVAEGLARAWGGRREPWC